ncbi:MAG: peptidyl-prolyl cis-trans isomerase [Blastocatellia bacterium]
MTLDSTNDKQPENTDATPDSNRETQATADSAATAEPASDAATTEAGDAVAAETHEAVAGDDTTVSEAAEAETAEAEAADESAADEADETSANAATVSSATAASKASLPTKAIAAVLVLAFVAVGGIIIQRSSSKPVSYNLTKHDMEVIFQEMIPPPQQAQMAANPDEKKKLIDEVKKLLSVAAFAESEGYAQRPEVQAQLALQTDLGLNDAYRKQYPETKISDEDINAYYQAHPNEFDTFLQSNPQFQQRAQGAQRDQFKKQYGEFKVIAERARKEKLDESEKVRLEMLIKRSDVLNNAYLSDLDKDPSKLGISDAEIEQYYQEHQGDFEEARTRIILISTQAQPPAPDAAKKGEQPKAPSKEDARKKAEEALAKARKGEDFVALVKQYSDNPDKDKGGETTLPSAQMPPDLVNLKPGEISNIIETPNGYVILKLEERKAGAGPSDPKIHQQIVNKLKKDKIDAKIDEIAKNSKVTVPEDFDMTVKAAEPPQLPAGHPQVPSDKQ